MVLQISLDFVSQSDLRPAAWNLASLVLGTRLALVASTLWELLAVGARRLLAHIPRVLLQLSCNSFVTGARLWVFWSCHVLELLAVPDPQHAARDCKRAVFSASTS